MVARLCDCASSRSWRDESVPMTLCSIVPLTTAVFSLSLADSTTMKLLARTLKEKARSSWLINPVTRLSQVTLDKLLCSSAYEASLHL